MGAHNLFTAAADEVPPHDQFIVDRDAADQQHARRSACLEFALCSTDAEMREPARFSR